MHGTVGPVHPDVLASWSEIDPRVATGDGRERFSSDDKLLVSGVDFRHLPDSQHVRSGLTVEVQPDDASPLSWLE